MTIGGQREGSGVVLVVQHEDDAGPGLLADALVATGLEADVWRAGGRRRLPGELGSYAGLVVLGGRMSANDTADFPYLVGVKQLIGEAAGRGVPALGICLGAQLAAAALGGRVMRRPDGPRIGWRAVAGNRGDPLTATLGDRARMFCWHSDRYDPPRGATLVLDGWDAFRVGSVSAFQPHPEVTAPIIAAWCATDGGADELARTGTDARVLVDEAAANEHVGLEILTRWCSEVSSLTGWR
jgi:GMP synthase-like glutamine amidotransferase